MDEQVQAGNIDAILHKLSGQRDKIVNYDIDLKKWKIKSLYVNAMWVKRLDEPSAELVMKGLLYVPSAKLRGALSVCEILMIGPDVKSAKVGDFVLVPVQFIATDAMRLVDGFKTYYIREDAALSVVEYEGSKEEAYQNIQDEVVNNAE